MTWYKTGTVSVVQNSNAVIGTSTAFIANSRVGDAFRGPDGGWYEVTNIASDTALSISPNYQGATNASGAYALAPMQGYVKDSADALRALVNQFGGVLAVLGETPTQPGVRASLNLTNTDGLPEGLTNKYATSENVRAATLNGLDLSVKTPVVATDTLLVAIGKLQAGKAAIGTGVSAGYIEGLVPQWSSSTSLAISPGTAYIPGTGKPLAVPTALTLSGLSLTSNTWYYLYLYENAGAPALELVTTPPAAPYSGTARTKTGDTSRRFVFAVKSNAGVGMQSFQIDSMGIARYRALLSAAPFRVVAGANQTAPTTVSLRDMVPLTTQTAAIIAVQGGTPVLFLGLPGDAAAVFNRVSAGSQVPMTVILDSGGQFSFWNSTTGGAATFDVAGYGMDR